MHAIFDSFPDLVQLAIHSSGIACLPEPYVKNDIAKGDLVNLDIKEKLRVREPLNAVYYKNIVLPSRTSSFVEFLAESLVLPSE
ncbi:LysR substrate-binding domain-containing protein [Klebsiella pneumoniae]|uniref:LysR substrate-binding domain-containing protein n=1 Tax=Klebsiella pneumoniae TaxID=573 RepID=UPI001090ACB8